MKKLIFSLIASQLFLIFSCGNNEGKNNNQSEIAKSESNLEVKEEIPFKKGVYEYHMVEAAGLQYNGKIVHGEAWTDNNGENIMIFSEVEEPQKGIDATSYYLYAYHYANSGNGFKLIREVKDYFEKCVFFNHTKFQNEFTEVTDLDENNYAEITFTYRTGCNSDPTPVIQKLIMLENGEKFAIRGTTLIENAKFGIAPSGSFGGETNIDKSFDKAPQGFLKLAKEIWAKAYLY